MTDDNELAIKAVELASGAISIISFGTAVPGSQIPKVSCAELLRQAKEIYDFIKSPSSIQSAPIKPTIAMVKE